MALLCHPRPLPSCEYLALLAGCNSGILLIVPSAACPSHALLLLVLHAPTMCCCAPHETVSLAVSAVQQAIEVMCARCACMLLLCRLVSNLDYKVTDEDIKVGSRTHKYMRFSQAVHSVTAAHAVYAAAVGLQDRRVFTCALFLALAFVPRHGTGPIAQCAQPFRCSRSSGIAAQQQHTQCPG